MTQPSGLDFTKLAPLPQWLRCQITAALAEAANARAGGEEPRILRSDEQIRKVIAEVTALQKSAAFEKMFREARPARGEHAVCDALAKRMN
jgi:hypothetical protein